MQLRHEEGRRGSFHIDDKGKSVARLDYFHPNPDTINVNHTEVSEEHRGQGLGQQLVDGAVSYARGKGLKVAAACPYARKILEKTADYADVFQA